MKSKVCVKEHNTQPTSDLAISLRLSKNLPEDLWC